MNQQTFIIGNREFTAVRMNAFAANRLLMRLQKVVMPIIGATIGSGKSMGDIDVKEAAAVIAEHLDESIMDSIVLPLFSESKLFSIDDKKFIKDEMSINQCFTADNLFDLYELIFELGRWAFGPFFGQLMSRFGSLTGGEKKAKTTANSAKS